MAYRTQRGTIRFYPCKGTGVYQCGYGDCTLHKFHRQQFLEHHPAWNQKSNATSIPPPPPPKPTRALVVGLGVGIPLFVLLLASIWVIFYQYKRLLKAWVPRKSTDKPPDWQWPRNYSVSTTEDPLPSQPGTTYSSPLRYTSPTVFGAQKSNPAGSELGRIHSSEVLAKAISAINGLGRWERLRRDDSRVLLAR